MLARKIYVLTGTPCAESMNWGTKIQRAVFAAGKRDLNLAFKMHLKKQTITVLINKSTQSLIYEVCGDCLFLCGRMHVLKLPRPYKNDSRKHLLWSPMLWNGRMGVIDRVHSE